MRDKMYFLLWLVKMLESHYSAFWVLKNRKNPDFLEIFQRWFIFCWEGWAMLAKPTGEMGFPKENEYFTSIYAAGAAAKSLQSCPTLCSPIDGSPPGSPIPGILQVRTLEWVALSFSNAWKWKVKVKLLSRFWLLATPWTAAHQAPPSMGFSRQEYWSGLPLPSPNDGCYTN